MRKLTLLIFIFSCIAAAAQDSLIKVSSDTVTIVKNDSTPAELILKNNTSSLAGGIAYNAGNGWLRFKSLSLSDISGLTAALNSKLSIGSDLNLGTYGFQNLSTPNIALINDVSVGKGGGNLSTNLAFGYEALSANSTGEYNMALGFQSLASNVSSSYNTGIGYYSLRNITTGYGNTGIGAQALFANTEGRYNLAIGLEALASNSTGVNNTAIGGYDVMLKNTSGSHNTAIGYAALYSNTTGIANVGIGLNALYEGTTGSNNTALGASAGYKNKGEGNTFIGYAAGLNNVIGNGNTYIGIGAGQSGNGSNNIAIGAGAVLARNDADNQLNIGNLIYGNMDSGFIGIGYPINLKAGARLAVSGNTFINGSVAAAGLISEAPEGIAPLQVNSTTLVPNLNVERWNGYKLNLTDSLSTLGLLVGYKDSAFISVRPDNVKSLFNIDDAFLLNRANHTGSQPASTITGLSPVSISGSYKNLIDTPVIPTNNDQLINGAGYLTSEIASNPNSDISNISMIMIDHKTNINNLYSSLGFSWAASTSSPKALAGLAFRGSNYNSGIGELVLFSGNGRIVVNSWGDMMSNANASFGNTVTASKFISRIPDGGAPLEVSSSTLVPNLNAEKWNGYKLRLEDSSSVLSMFIGYKDSALVSISSESAKKMMNIDDTFLLNRANHKGTQPVSTISGLALIATSGSYNDLVNKPVIPSNNNQLVNGAGYISSEIASSPNNSIGKSPAFLINHGTSENDLYSSVGFSWPNSTSNKVPIAGIAFHGTNFNAGAGELVLFSGNGKVRISSGGDLTATGNVTAFSDERLKTNIMELAPVTDRLKKIKAFEYDRKDLNSHQIGFVAQEVEKFFPSLVLTTPDDINTKSINYQAFTSPLLKGWQESEERISNLEKENKKLLMLISDLTKRLQTLEKAKNNER